MAGNSFGKLFTLPVQVPIEATAVSPAAELYFYETGTTTDLTVYTTPALSVAHAQPVVADSAGEFAPIYLDPEASVNYTVTLKDSDGNTLWSEDNVNPRASGFETGTFSVTWAGFSADPSNTTATYYRFDRLVQLILPLGTGTSNSTSFSLSGILPSTLYPTTTQYYHLPYAVDNGSHLAGGAVAQITNSGNIVFAPADAAFSTTGWTNSGSKGINTVGEIWYRVIDV